MGHTPTWCQKCFPKWYLQEDCFHGSTSRFCPQRISKACLQTTEGYLWTKAGAKSLVSEDDTALFIQRSSLGIIALLLYVDDMLVTSSLTVMFSEFLEDLKMEFSMKDLGQVNYFLGIKITRTEHGLFL